MRTLIVGDVHGCYQELEALLEAFGFVIGSDRLFQVGDLINKGPDSCKTLDLIEKVGGRCVMGNHEARVVQIWNKPVQMRSEKEKHILLKLGDAQRVVETVRHWPLWLEISGEGFCPAYTIVHAGLEPNQSHLETMNPHCLLAIRTWDGKGENLNEPENPPWYECVHWPQMIVYGHWALKGLNIREGFRGLDTGCVYGGSLTGWCPESDSVYQIPARKIYQNC